MKNRIEPKFFLFLIFLIFLSVTAAGCAHENAGAEEAASSDISETEADVSVTMPDSGSIFGMELIDNKEYSAITMPRDPTGDALISLCSVNAVPAAYSDYNGTFYATVKKGSDFSDYSISFEAAESVKVFVVKMEYDRFSGTLDDAVQSGYNFLFLAVNEKSSRIYRLVLTYLPVMTVTGNGHACRTPEDGSNPFSSSDSRAYITFRSCDEYYESSTLIHQRGGSSRSFPKTSYRLNLRDDSFEKKNKLNLLGMRKDDDWILMAMYTDESKIRDKMSMDLWLDMTGAENSRGEKFGTEIEYIELIIDGCYWGIYGLTVPVDGVMAETDTDNGEILVKTESWEIPYSGDILRANHSTSMGSLTIKEPEPPDQDDWDVLADFMSIVYESSDEEFASRITDYISVPTAIDHWIFVNVISGVDNAWKNMFLSFKRSGNGYRVDLCPWDCDISWGVNWTGRTALFWEKDIDYLVSYIGAQNMAGRMLVTMDEAGKYLVSRWAELRSGLLSEEALFERADRLNEEVRGCGAYDRDTARWPNGGHTDDVNNDYIRKFITLRLDYLDRYISDFE